MAESKVEITGFLARHYDNIINIASLGSYSKFIRNAIGKMNIQAEDRILDLGCGTGRNACLMAQYLSTEGAIVGVEIGAEMIERFERNCQRFTNIIVVNARIDEAMDFENEFDKALLSFVFHGFPQEKQDIIIDNVKKALKPGGQLFLLDYEEFDLSEKSALFRWGFEKFECRLAQDYLKVDWKQKLSELGFGKFGSHLFYRNLIRLLKAELLKNNST